MAINHGDALGSVRYHFPTSEKAWQFANDMVSYGRTVTDFGFDNGRAINHYFVDIA